jgi:hypothetical protein
LADISPEIVELTTLSRKIYPLPCTRQAHDIDVKRLIDLAVSNNLLALVNSSISKKYRDEIGNTALAHLLEKQDEADRNAAKIRRTLTLIRTILPDALLLKTYRGYDRVPNDMDILVGDWEDSVAKLKESGFRQSETDPKNMECIFTKSTYWKIHLHGTVSWCDRNFFDDLIIFKEVRTVTYFGVHVKIPGFTADFLVHLAHMNFEPLHMLLSELLYLYSIGSKVDYGLLLAQSKKYRWKKTLLRTLAIMDFIHAELFGANFFSPRVKLQSCSGSSLAFPYIFSKSHIIRAFLEKGIVLYPLRRMPKTIKILLRGDTITGFYEAPEARKG